MLEYFKSVAFFGTPGKEQWPFKEGNIFDPPHMQTLIKIPTWIILILQVVTSPRARQALDFNLKRGKRDAVICNHER